MFKTNTRLMILIGAFLLVFVAVPVYLAYQEIYVGRNYYVRYAVECDPAVSSCFVFECNPEEAECFRDMEEGDIAYYKTITEKESESGCDPSRDESCLIACEPGEDCVEAFCEPGGEDVCSGDFMMNKELEEQ